MTLKIISGTFKGRILSAPKDIRPATANLRDAIFNIIGPSIEDSYFLDIFAGSGALGLEALSRGAKFSYFIDASKISIKFIYENIKKLKVELQTKVILHDAIKALKKIDVAFDYISIDPPFILFKQNLKYLSDIFSIIFQNNLLKKNGIIFLEEPTYSKRDEKIENFLIKDKRKYGSAFLFQYILEKNI
ncbi:MAG: 16S rRNA (guanine(966)-N(2))-methyltransferase RsmD [Parachlamydiales bacterium]|nr:16S rRNA (guanine(966)-N(2))-methyltransferase RsmD [Parachlamydiales bacterium]